MFFFIGEGGERWNTSKNNERLNGIRKLNKTHTHNTMYVHAATRIHNYTAAAAADTRCIHTAAGSASAVDQQQENWRRYAIGLWPTDDDGRRRRPTNTHRGVVALILDSTGDRRPGQITWWSPASWAESPRGCWRCLSTWSSTRSRPRSVPRRRAVRCPPSALKQDQYSALESEDSESIRMTDVVRRQFMLESELRQQNLFVWHFSFVVLLCCSILHTTHNQTAGSCN